MTQLVQLRAAKIPGIIGLIAVHYWLVIVKKSQCDRWEVWQKANCGKLSWGHLHKNLMVYNQGVGNGDSWVEYEWEGEKADRLIEIIENSPYTYPFNYKYRYFPGPNSNTYVQWILKEAKTDYRLGKLGIGKGYFSITQYFSSKI